MSTLTHRLQHISGKDYDRRLRGSRRHCQHWIDGLAEEEEELGNLVEHLDKASTSFGMDVSAQKTKLMTNDTSGINTGIKVNEPKA